MLESDLMPTLVELIRRYIIASVKAVDMVGGKNMEELTSADYYMGGVADEGALMYAVIHCFIDLIGFVPNAAVNK